MKKNFPVSVLIIMILGCISNTNHKTSFENTNQEKTTASHSLIFKGTLPCADCEGIETTLQLFVDSAQVANNYKLIEKYLGKPDHQNIIHSEGKYVTLYYEDSTIIIYRLNPEDPSKARFYRKINENEIIMMTQANENINSKLNYTLKRQ
jgi:copper homeostasis protein (lipoprotein)